MFDEDNTFKNFTNWHIPAMDREVAATVLAKMAVHLDPEADEYEMYDIIFDFIKQSEALNLVNIVDLVTMMKCTKPNPKFDTFH